MITIFSEFIPQPVHSARSLYISLIGDKDTVNADINLLDLQLQKIISGEAIVEHVKNPIAISRATNASIMDRIDELKGNAPRFQTTQVALCCNHQEALLATEGLAMQLTNAGVELIERGVILINELCTLYYDEHGNIIKTIPDLGLNGRNAVELIAGVCSQDFGLVINRDNRLVYLYGSSSYEKTPKHVETGYDYFLGEDFLEWHRRIPGCGPTLASIFGNLYSAFKQDKVDTLIVDLKGRNLYNHGETTVRRYERDYALPLVSIEGEIIGMTVFADSLFKNVKDENLSFVSGNCLQISSPREFNEHFSIIKDAEFKHHPFGMRDKDGNLALSPNS